MIKFSNKTNDYIIQVFLIVGSVLLALWLDQMMADRAENKKMEVTINNIISEVENNIKAVEAVVGYHKKVSSNLSSFIDTVEFNSIDKNAMEIIAGFIPNGLQVARMQNTAWNMAIETETISLFKYEMAYDMTELYDLQTRGVESTTTKIMDYLTNPSLFDIEQNTEVTMVFHFAMNELSNQEGFLIEEYKRFMNKYKNK